MSASLELTMIMRFYLTDAKTLKTKQLLKVASGGNYVKSANEKDLIALGKNLSITKLGVNVLYSRFWYANYRGLPGLHASCPPDWLHTIIKGAVEKTLAASLLIVEYFSHFDISVIYGGKRCLPWKYNKSILDHRSKFFPIHLFFDKFCRYVVIDTNSILISNKLSMICMFSVIQLLLIIIVLVM